MFYDTDSIADTFNEDREKREKRKSNVGKNKTTTGKYNDSSKK